MKKIKMFFVFLFATLVFATGCGYLPDLDVSFTSNSNGNSSSVTKEYYDMSGVSFNGASYVYDGEEHSLSIEGTLPDGVSVMYLNNNKVNAGTYEVVAKFTGDTKKYHPIEDMKATLTIAKAGVNGISFLGYTVTYDGNPHSIEINGELPEGILVTYSGNEQVNVGVYEVVAHFTDTTGNYVELSDLKATLTINKATYDMSNIKFNSASYTYDGIEKEVKIEGELPSGVEVLYENNRMINAGTIEAIAMFKHNNPNYNDIPNKTATLTINKASIEGISFSGDTVTYDGKAHSLSIEGKLPEGVYVTYINNGHINAGTYTVTAHFEDSTGNYEYLPDLEATLVINKVEVNEIEFNGKTVVYNGEVYSLEIEGTLPNGVQVIYSNNNHINAGTYTVVASFIDTTGNYDLPSYLEATLTINKKIVEVDFDNKEVIYNGEKQILKLNSTLPSGVYAIYSDNEFINVGEYEVIVQIIDTTGNYNIEEILTATLIINKANIEGISFIGSTLTYDGYNHSIYVNGYLPQGIEVEYSNNNQINAGEYEITAVFYDTTGNYIVPEPMTAILIINKLTIDVSLEDQTVSYDGEYHSLSLNGYIPNGISVINTNNSFNKVGEYTVTYTFKDTTGNYNIVESLEATLTIVKDGKYHDVIFIFEDGTTKEYVIANDSYLYNIPSVPYKKGHTGVWDSDTSLPITNDIVFNVEYTPNQYTITYDAQGGELEETTQVVTYGDLIILPIPTRLDFEFLGWYYNDELFEYSRYEFTKDVILVAKWKHIKNDIIKKSLCNLGNNYTVTYTDENNNTYFTGIEETEDKKGIYVYFESSNNGYYIDENNKIYYAYMGENGGLSYDSNQQLSGGVYQEYIKVKKFKTIFNNVSWQLVSNEKNMIFETNDTDFISLCSLFLNISTVISNIQVVFDENDKLNNFIVNSLDLNSIYTFKIENINNTNIINYGTANPLLVGAWCISELDKSSLLGGVGSYFEISNEGATLLKYSVSIDTYEFVVDETFLFISQEDPSTYLFRNDIGDIIKIKSMFGAILDNNGDRIYNAGLSFTTIDAETQTVANGIAISYYEISFINAIEAYNYANQELPTTYSIRIIQPYEEEYDSFVTDLGAIGAYYVAELDADGNEVEAGIYTQWATIDDFIDSLNGLFQGGFDSTLYNGCALGFYLYSTFFLTAYATDAAVNILYNISMFLNPVYVDIDITKYATPTEGQSQRDYVVFAMESLGYTAIYDSYVVGGQDYISLIKDNNSNEENGIICEEVIFFESTDGSYGCMLVINDNGSIYVQTMGFGYFIVIGTIYEIIETWSITQA